MLGRFRSAHGSEPTIDAPRRVPYWGDKTLETAGRQADAHDWRSLETFLRGLSPHHVRDAALLGLVHQINGRPKWIDKWVAERPQDYLALTFRGAHSIHWAWEARGHGRAANTSRSAFDEFFARLAMAREDLLSAARLAPADETAPWVHQLTMARGLQYDKAAQRGIFDELRAREPWHPIGFSSMVQCLAPKWSGDWDSMMELAKSTRQAPEGSSVHVALLEAHREGEIQQGPAYWTTPGIREDVLSAAELSIDSPLYLTTIRSVRDHNWFLYAYGRLGEASAFERELQQVRGRLTAPFTLFGDPVLTYRSLRVGANWSR